MNIERIHVRGRFEATRFDADYRLLVISVSNPDSDKPKFERFCVMDKDKDVLSLRFDDVCLRQWDREQLAELWPDCKPMHSYHAKQIKPFLASRLREGVSTVLIHCEAGLSRSPSIAMAICDCFELPREIIDWQGRNVNADAPNQHVYETVCAALLS